MAAGSTRSAGRVLLAALVVLVGSWALAHAQQRRDDAGTMLPLSLLSLHVTPEQDAKLREIIATHRATSQALLGQLRRTQDQLTDTLLAPGPLKQGDLLPQLQTIARLREWLLQDDVKLALEVRALLTPHQLGRASRVKDRLRQINAEMEQIVQPAGRGPAVRP